MCQSVPSNFEATPLSPHDYPIWIKGFGAIVVVVLLVSFVTFPPYLIAGRQLHRAENSLKTGDFKAAAETYLDILKKFPKASEARLGAAEALFSEKNEAASEQALVLLQGVELDKYDWKRLQKVMPQEYQDAFETIDKKSAKSKAKSKGSDPNSTDSKSSESSEKE